MGLNADVVGKRYGTVTYEVTAQAIDGYARATNDLNPRYLGEDVVASPVFAVVPAFGSFMAAATDPELGADLLKLVHGAEEHVLHMPIRPGDVLTVEPVLESVELKDTGETFTVGVALGNQRGEHVADVRGTMFIRGTGSRRVRPPRDTEEHEVVFEQTVKVDGDQTARYAEASGDFNPIHLDDNVARMAGLPGIINHGMCTMAMAVKAAVDGLAGGDPTKVRRAAVRFSKPVFPGQELTTKLWLLSEGGDAAKYGFETYGPAGMPVITMGEIEVAKP